MRVIIRADGNREIAMGHIMRCLSVADALRAAGAEVVFVTAGEETRELITGRGYGNTVLGTSFRDLEAELPAFHDVFRDAPAELILIDSYFVTLRYMREVGSWTKTAYIDDMGRPVYPADILINYNIYAQELPYGTWYGQSGIPSPGRSLLGCAYAPLRAEFQKGKRSRNRETVRDVLITTGGGDMVNAAGKLCGRLAAETEEGLHRGVRYHVICGPFSEKKRELQRLSETHREFCIHENVTYMSEIMEKCDIAVSAAGGTMYELCSMRLPAVCFYFAENQRQMAEYFDRTTDIRNAGDMANEEERTLDALLEQLGRLESDRALRERIRMQMERLTDGRGAVRIAEALLGQCQGGPV